MHHVTAHGAEIPALGLGTFRLTGEQCRRIVGKALEIGYRHIDTAQMYGNEREVGDAVRQSGVPRDEVWITTKVWPDRYEPDDFRRSVEESLQKLGTEPDLLLLHWPRSPVPLRDTVAALNRAKRDGLARNIGISNFSTALIDEAWSLTEEPLAVLQVEYHCYLDQRAVLAAVRGRGMALTAYSPVAQGKVFREPLLQRIGERHGKNPGQIALRWLVQQDRVTAIPRSSKEANVAANLDVFDFTLADDEMREIGALGSRDGRLLNPAGLAPDWD